MSIYVLDSIKYDITEELCEDGNHYLWISINKLSLNVGAIYKPGQTNINNFLNTYTSQLERRKRSIVFGDFNIDLLSGKSNDVTKYLTEIQQSGYQILNNINKSFSTRDTSTTKTILDHVSTNFDNHSLNMTIIESSLSDHKQIFVEIGRLTPHINKKIPYKALHYENLYNNMQKAIYTNDDNDYYYLERFISEQIENNKIDKLKIINSPQKDWVNKDILNAINVRNNLWQQLKLQPKNNNLRQNYMKERNNVRHLISSHKKTYYYNLFQKNYSRPKKTWELINNLGLNKIKDSVTPPKLMSSSGIITEGNLICDLFNQFFSTIGVDLANKIPKTYHTNTGNTLMYEHNHTHNQQLTVLTPCTTTEISKIIDELDSNTSTGLDGISTKAIKCLKDIIAERLMLCINKCLTAGIFPDTLKVAKVSPIFKSGSKTDPSNYRPVSVLPVISKIFERILYNRLNNYLSEKKILIDEQYGFRPKSSTVSATVDLMTKIYTAVDQGSFALGIFIDLKKAFDTVSHKKLLEKLNNIGVTGLAYDIFKSYLENRTQVVKIDTYTSSTKIMTCGCPQGSIISPLLFLIYINNINKIGLAGHLTLYADDTCLFYFDKSIHKIIADAQNDLNIINEWLKYNLLTINTAKTSFMIITAKNKRIPDFPPLKINNDVIKQSHHEKYLGLWLDDKLTWQIHINYVKTKLNSLLGALRKASNCIPKKVRNILYNSLIKSNLEYLIEIWGSAALSNLSPLQRLQNKIIKTLFHYPYLTPTTLLYKKTNLLNIKQLYTYNTCVLIKNILSKSIQSNIHIPKKETSHNLRNRHKLELSKTRTNYYGQRSILFGGVQLYNKLPSDITECDNIKIFKCKLKKYVQCNQF